MSYEFDYTELRDIISANNTTEVSEFPKTLRETLYQKLDHDHNETDYQMRLLTDELSDALIPQDIAINDIMALKTTGDGYCLFHAASLALTGM